MMTGAKIPLTVDQSKRNCGKVCLLAHTDSPLALMSDTLILSEPEWYWLTVTRPDFVKNDHKNK